VATLPKGTKIDYEGLNKLTLLVTDITKNSDLTPQYHLKDFELLSMFSTYSFGILSEAIHCICGEESTVHCFIIAMCICLPPLTQGAPRRTWCYHSWCCSHILAEWRCSLLRPFAGIPLACSNFLRLCNAPLSHRVPGAAYDAILVLLISSFRMALLSAESLRASLFAGSCDEEGETNKYRRPLL